MGGRGNPHRLLSLNMLARLTPKPIQHLLVALLAMLATAALLLAFRSHHTLPPPPALSADQYGLPRPGASTAQQVAALSAAARRHPADAQLLTMLGLAELQRVRENGDATLYTRADQVLHRANAIRPGSVQTITALATLALARHQFHQGLELALRAHALAPAVVSPLGAIVDGEVELGRYTAAARSLQQMIDEQPSLSSYSRASYLRELHGDLPAAIDDMQRAVSAGGGVPENVAYVQTLLAGLQFASGRVGLAERTARQALYLVPGYVPTQAQLAQDLAADGRLPSAIRLLRGAIARLPLPQYVVQIGETELAAGRRSDARRDFALVGVEERLLRANGVNTDVDLALFEAGHGNPRRGVVLARRAWAEAPSVRSADALGWALTRSGRPVAGLIWARRALRLGSRDPNFLFHAGMAAYLAGQPSLSRSYLGRAVAENARFSPLYAPQAHRVLKRLGR
jgi:tetratricopeptide (TPR) repeat protein